MWDVWAPINWSGAERLRASVVIDTMVLQNSSHSGVEWSSHIGILTVFGLVGFSIKLGDQENEIAHM